MKRVHHLILALLAIILLLFSAEGLAATLQTSITGTLTPEVKQNVDLMISKFESGFPLSVTRENAYQLYRKGPDEIKKAMEPFGYFRAHITPQISFSNNQWLVSFQITPGPQIRISKLDLKITGEGAFDPQFIKLEAVYPIKVGEPLITQNYEDAKQVLYDLASQRGYFDSKMIENKIIVDLNTYQATVIIHFDTGPRFHFGSTTFSQTPFSSSFLKRFLTYHEGEPYTSALLAKTQQGLASQGYFRQVIASPEMYGAKKNEVPIDIHMIMEKQLQYIFGLGVGTDTGPRATAGLTYRWVNKHGHRFQTLARVSKKNSALTTNYVIPGPNPANSRFTLSGGLGYLNLDETGKSRNANMAGSFTWFAKDWQQTLSLTALTERYNIRNLPQTSSQVIYPSFEMEYMKNKYELRPQNGIYIAMNIAGASKDVLSKTSFWQARLTAKTLITLFHSTRLLVRGEVGYTDIKNVNSLPLSLQLLAGGARSIRGFTYNSIGPGKSLIIGSFEIQQRIYKDFFIGAFYDAGQVANSINFRKLNEGIGPALIWLSPVGTVELSFANAISAPGKHKPWLIQFSIGPDL